MSLYIQKFCTVMLHIIMLTLQYRHTEINKTNISLNKVSVYLSFGFYYMSWHAILLTRLTIYSTCILDMLKLDSGTAGDNIVHTPPLLQIY